MNNNIDIVVDGDRTPRNVIYLHGSICEGLSGYNAVRIDLRQVTSLDVTAVQVLLAARKSAESRGRQIAILSEPGGALAVTLQRLGLPPTTVG